MIKPRPKTPNPILIFLQADGFSRAYNILAAQQLAHWEQASIGYPQIVISSLASELFLKCLICIETGRTVYGHSLEQLYNQLSPDMRQQICAIWDREVVPLRNPLWDAIEGGSSGEKVPRSLPDSLARAHKAFERVRYVYEGIDGVSFFLTDLPTVLKRVILRKHPEWRTVRRKVEEGGPIKKAG